MQHSVLQEIATGEKYTLVETETIVGRSPRVDLPVLDKTVALRQFRILISDGHFTLEVLANTPATLINGVPVSGRQSLEHDAEIRVGKTSFRFLAPSTGISSKPQNRTLLPARENTVPRAGQTCDATVYATYGTPMASQSLGNSCKLPSDGILRLGREVGDQGLSLPHVLVSRRHAEIVRRANRTVIQDIHSANGTYVNGKRITAPTDLRPNDRIDIGPYSLTFDGHSLSSTSNANNIELECQNVSLQVKNRSTGRPLYLLDRVSLIAKPRDFICVLGPSGSGKSTLLSLISGRRRSSKGRIALNGVSLQDNFESLKQNLTVVPQQVILHNLLTVEKALRFSAELRLPPDSMRDEIEQVVDEMLETVQLSGRRGIQIQHLSGGQIKRACLANEIVHKPSLLLLDEVTSGLDEHTDGEMMRLFRKLSDDGKTVVCITHNLVNVEEFANLVAILTVGGKLAFYGEPQAALDYFEVDKLGDVYGRLQTASPESWQEKFNVHRHLHESRLPAIDSSAHKAVSVSVPIVDGPDRMKHFWHQLGILLRRTWALKLADLRSMGVIVLQCVLVAVLIGLLFGDVSPKSVRGAANQQTASGPSQEEIVAAGYSTRILFLMAISCLWFGCNNSVKEIIKDRTIYERERSVNLRIDSFLASQAIVLCGLSIIQASILYGCVQAACHLPIGLVRALCMLWMCAVTGAGLGLLISSLASNEDTAVRLVPVLLIPQIILAGLLRPVEGVTKWIAQGGITSYWSLKGLNATFEDKYAAILGVQNDSFIVAIFVVILHAAIALVMTFAVLRIQSKHTAR